MTKFCSIESELEDFLEHFLAVSVTVRIPAG
jgi:hypothetical protein